MSKPIPEEKLTQLSDMIAGGNKVGAIKLYRELTGSDLAEAKGAIEKLEAELRTQFPDKFPKKQQAKGCLGSVAVVCVSVILLIIFGNGIVFGESAGDQDLRVLDLHVLSEEIEGGSNLLIVLYLQNTGEKEITVLTKNLEFTLLNYTEQAPEISLNLATEMTVQNAVVISSLYDFSPVTLKPGEAAMVRASHRFRRNFDEVIIEYDMLNEWSRRFGTWNGRVRSDVVEPMKVDRLPPLR